MGVVNFQKQKSRLKSQLKIMGNKLKKKDGFAVDAASLKSALGGNLTNPSCGASSETSAPSSRSTSSAAEVGMILANCSATIDEACPEITINATVEGFCNDV